MPDPVTSPPAPAAAAPKYEKVYGVEGLYVRHDRGGQFYSRVSVNGRRTWKCLRTETLTVAKLRHRKFQVTAERSRQAKVNLTSEFNTLGACAVEFGRRLEQSSLAHSSRQIYRTNLERLRRHFPAGRFDRFPVRAVTHDVLFSLRAALQNAKVAKGRKDCVRKEYVYTGYAPTAVNDTLAVLRRLLDIAIEYDAMVENPFYARAVLREKVRLPKQSRRPSIPDRATLERVLAEIRRGAQSQSAPSQGWVRRQAAYADSAADFAEFLAYSGARWNEANGVLVRHYSPARGETPAQLTLLGTKTATARRTIPAIPPLCRLLDRLVAGRNGDEKLLRTTGCLYPLRKACVRLGMPLLTQHDLRHYFATFCLEKTQDVKAVAEWLGHADGGQLVLATYSHLLRGRSFALAQLVD